MAQNNAESSNPFEDMLTDKEAPLAPPLDEGKPKDAEETGEHEEEAPTTPPVSQETLKKGKKGLSPPKGPTPKQLQEQFDALKAEVGALRALLESKAPSQLPPQSISLPEIDDLLTWTYELDAKRTPATAKGLVKWLKAHHRPWTLPGALALIKAYVKEKQRGMG